MNCFLGAMTWGKECRYNCVYLHLRTTTYLTYWYFLLVALEVCCISGESYCYPTVCCAIWHVTCQNKGRKMSWIFARLLIRLQRPCLVRFILVVVYCVPNSNYIFWLMVEISCSLSAVSSIIIYHYLLLTSGSGIFMQMNTGFITLFTWTRIN